MKTVRGLVWTLTIAAGLAVVVSSAAQYPSAIKSFTTRVAGDTIQPAHINDLQDEVAAIETDILSTGLTLTSGKVKFPATQVSSSGVNDLDDYEEGSWTPTIASSGGGTPTYTTQVGGYVKIGKQVQYWGRITLATKGTLAAGNVRIGGLPFTAENTTSLFGVTTIGLFAGMTTSVEGMSGYVQTNDTIIPLQMLTAAATASSNVTVADIGATVDLIFGGSYRATQ